jgi:hypothetical protein
VYLDAIKTVVRIPFCVSRMTAGSTVVCVELYMQISDRTATGWFSVTVSAVHLV